MRKGREGEGKGRRAARGHNREPGWGTHSTRWGEGVEDLRWNKAL